MKDVHTPVMVAEILEYLQVQPGGYYVDATLGAGGHAVAILEKSAPDGRLIGIDADCVLLNETRNELHDQFSDRIETHCAFFDTVQDIVTEPVDGILFDLGVASWHFEESGRGFSFQRDEPLDMRLSEHQKQTAADIVNHADVTELERIIDAFGEDRYARRIAKAIVRARPIATSSALANIVADAVPRRGRIHPATRTFQALRIAVNDELGRLERALAQVPNVVQPGGRCVVIAFHSLEDRIVKQTFRSWGRTEQATILTTKPLTPTQDEISVNPRARSAKFRAVEFHTQVS